MTPRDANGPSAVPALELPVPRRAFVAQIMGLPISVHVRGPLAGEQPVRAAVEAAFDALRADDALFSTWRQDSPVSRVRRGELDLERAAADHPRLREVLDLCALATERTDGAFSAWLPDADGRPSFDPTGLVKGWAVEQAFDALAERLSWLGRHDLLVSAGGDVLVTCTRTDTPDWTVGVEDPRDRSRMLLTLPLRRGAVATSGTAARGAHILDPATRAPATGLLSATVIGPSLTWADVYATAAFVHGSRAPGWLTTLADHAAVLVEPDGTVRRVTGGSLTSGPTG